MRRIIFTLITLWCCSLPLKIFGQYKTLILNYEKSAFGDNEPLPARKYFNITGVISSEMGYVEVVFYTAKDKRKGDPIYQNFWKRDLNSQSTKFTTPIHYKLREGRSYDVIVRYFKKTTSLEKDSLRSGLLKILEAYVNQSYEASGKKVKFRKSTKRMLMDLNKVVTTGAMLYRTRTMTGFQGFSDVVALKFEQIEGQNLNEKTDSKQFFSELKGILTTELEQYLNNELYVLADDKLISNYPTEKIQNYLPVNIGYGGALLDTDFDNFNYATAPYVGLSFPFGKEGGKSKFWSRASFSVGVILNQNLKDQDQTEFTGPIFNLPLYAALGYRAFRFIRVNAGITVLENVADTKIDVYPFIGISAELNLSLHLAKD